MNRKVWALKRTKKPEGLRLSPSHKVQTNKQTNPVYHEYYCVIDIKSVTILELKTSMLR